MLKKIYVDGDCVGVEEVPDEVMVEVPRDAKQKPKASPDNASSSPQPAVRKKAGDTSKGS